MKKTENLKGALTEENLREWYWDEELSTTEIAVSVGCNRNTVLRYMKKHSILRRTISESKQLARGLAGILTEENLRKWYWDEKLSPPKIAAVVGCNKSTVNEYMKRHHIPKREGGASSIFDGILTEEFLVQWYWVKKLTLKQIAEKVGCNSTTVMNWMRASSIPSRSGAEAARLAWTSDDTKLGSDEHRQRQSKGIKVAHANPESIFHTDEYKHKKAMGIKKAWTRSDNNLHSEERSRKIAEKVRAAWARGVWDNEEWKCKQSEANSGENASNWRGGKSFEPYPPTFNEAFKRKIRKRDNYTCAICKLEGNCVHHINYIKDNTTPENCIVLCTNCHPVTNFNRDYWQVALTDLMATKTLTAVGLQQC